MKDYLRQILQDVSNPVLARCRIREYLQARLLQTLQDHYAFETWAFVGGTALRFLFGLPRFSEDLDFSLIESGADDRFRALLTAAKQTFVKEGYQVTVKLKDDKTVKSAFVRFSGILNELGLSPLPAESLAIKVEIDTNPPAGAHVAMTTVRRHIIINLQHYDRASLLAGKLHAVLTRKYTKGRDLYDLMWYFSDRTWPAPNLDLLNNSLQQTGWGGPSLNESNWRPVLQQRLDTLDWKAVADDVRPFLERPTEESLLSCSHLKTLIDPM
jgi:predicted nucleotidyltransferase component of viral defense system